MPKNNNGRTVTDQSSMNAYIKSVCDIMRRDRTKGALEYIPELTWMMFLRILDEKEQEEELNDVDLLKSLGIILEIEGADRPTIAGLLLLGKEQLLKKFLQQNEIIYFRFEKSDVDPVQSAYMKMPLLKTTGKRTWRILRPDSL